MSTQTLSFYTTGEGFTELVRNFIREGEFKRAHDILLSGGMPEDAMEKFFKFELKFKGDTREGDHTLAVVKCKCKEDLTSMLETATRTCLKQHKRWFTDLNDLEGRVKEEFDTLYKFYNKKDLIMTLLPMILKTEGYGIANPSVENMNGVILSNGTFVTCGYEDHRNLYPLLYSLDLVEASDWMDEETAIHVSSGQMNGRVSNSIDHNFRNVEIVTDEQINTLSKFKSSISGTYGAYDGKLMESLNNYVNRVEDFGGKFGNLTFLRRFYPNINLPQFSKHPQMIDINHKTCIRTSPKYSLPGLLNSKFDVKFGKYEDTIEEIKADFEKYKDVRGDNKLYYFFQQQLDGANGVCHVRGRAKEFSYSLSSNQGDIVGGKVGNLLLSPDHENELRLITSELADDFDKSIQLEFVVSDDKLYVVQLRVLGNEYDETVIVKRPKSGVIGLGLTFSKGREVIDVKDILVVERDANSDQLLGKKALVVKEKVEFSHILALSKSLGIPSMYGVENLKLPENGTVNFVAQNKESWITK